MPLQTPATPRERGAEHPRAAGSAARRFLPPDVAWGLLAMGAALASAAAVLRVWRADLSVPFQYEFDALFHSSLVKGVLDHGWHQTNPSLGAPFGQELYDLPQNGDNLQLLLIKALGLLGGGFGETINVYFLLTFPLVALTAFVVLRALGLSRPVAAACALLFALLPYHFRRRELHLFLSGYFAVPLGAWLVLCVLGGRSLWARRDRAGPRPLAWASRRSLLTLAACAVIASASVYYAGFTLVLLALAVPLVLIARGDWRAAAGGVAAMAAILAVFALNMAPVVVHRAKEGTNEEVVNRRPSEAERYALKLTQLVLPVEEHRLGPLARARERYVNSTSSPDRYHESYSASLGLAASVGFAWLLLVAGLAMVRGGRSEALRERFGPASAAAVAAFAIATVGGVSTLIAYWLSAQLRAWNRLSVFIGFFSLLAVGLLLDLARRRWGAARRGRPLFLAGLGLLCVVGVLDQTSRLDVPRYRALNADVRSDRELVGRVQERLPRGAMVFQLPYQSFPESRTIVRMLSNDGLRPYLHSGDLRWSHGAMQGRREDWAEDLDGDPAGLIVSAVAAAGFDGIWIDRRGFRDRARGTEAILARLTREQPLVSRNRRMSFWDLGSYRRRLEAEHSPARLAALRQATLRPQLHVLFRPGFARARQEAGRLLRRGRPDDALVQIENRAKRPVPALFQARVRSANPLQLLLRYPDGSTQLVPVTPAGTPVARELRIPPGVSRIEVSSASATGLPSTGSAAFPLEWEDPVLVPDAFRPFL